MRPALRAALPAFLVSLIAYGLTLAPSIHVGDSGELAGAAATLGIAHPPGYPLWTLLGRLAVVLAPGAPAAATNALSALGGAAAAALLAALLAVWTGRTLVAAGVGVAFALARGPWSTAVVTEVYSLNLALTAAALLAAVAARRGRPALFLLAAYVLGLGTANHPFVLLAGPPVLLLALGPNARTGETASVRARRLLPMAGLFLLGLTTYLVLPVRLAAGPEWAWGAPRGLPDLVDHVLRAQYGGLGEASAEASLATRWRVLVGLLGESVPWPLALLGLAGLVLAWRDGHRKRAALVAGLFLLAGPVTAAVIRYEDTFLDRSVATPFFLPAVLAAFLAGGLGLAGLESRLRARLGGDRRILGGTTSVALAVAVPLALGVANVRVCDRSDATLARDYATEAFRELPERSLLFATGDNEVFILEYFHRIEGMRPDVTLLDRTLNLDVAGWGPELAALDRPERTARRPAREVELAFSDRDRSVFYTDLVDLTALGGSRLAVHGLLKRLLRPGEAPEPVPFRLFPVAVTDPGDFLECHLAGVTLFRQGEALAAAGRRDEALARWSEAADACGPNPVVLRNLAVVRREAGDAAGAEKLLERTLAIAPDDGDALFDLASLQAQSGRSAEAVVTFDRMLAAGWDLPEVHLGRGVELVRAGNLEEAARSAQRALELEPRLEPARRLAEAVGRGRELGGEAGLAEARRGLGDVTVDGTLQLAARYLDEGDVARATDLYREANAQAPENAGAAYGLGYGLLRVGRWGDAEEAFRRLLRIDPRSADGRNALAYVLAQTGDSLDVAERLAVEAIDLSPELAGYWYDTLGWVLYRQGRFEDALDALEESRRQLPPDDRSMRAENGYHLGATLLALGRTDEAREQLERSLALAGDEPWVPDLQAKAREAGLGPSGPGRSGLGEEGKA